MSEMTVKEFAKKVGRESARLLEQMHEAGLAHKSENDGVSEVDKKKLLDHLTKSHGGGAAPAAPKNRITLTRKTKSRINTAGGRGKSIEVQVRKKRTYVKDGEEQVAEAPAAAAEAPAAPVADKPAVAPAREERRDERPRQSAPAPAAAPVAAAPEVNAPPKEPRGDAPRRAKLRRVMSRVIVVKPVKIVASASVAGPRRSSALSVVVVVVAVAIATVSRRSRSRPLCVKSPFLSPSQWQTLRTRWPSKLLK